MKTLYLWVVSGLLVVMGMLLYPTLHLNVSSANTSSMLADGTITNFLPLTTFAMVVLPYAFLGLIVYAVIQSRK